MAEDRLIFGIGFDLDSAVDKAEKDFEKVLKDLQQVASKNPVSIDVSTKEIEVAKDSIIGLRKTLSDLGKEWDSMSRAAKFDESGNLTAEAKQLIENYSGITASLQQYGQSLKGITADIKEQAEAQMRYLSNDEAVNKAIQARTVAIQAQRKAIEEADKAFTQLNAQGKAYAAGGGLTTEAQSVVNNRIAATKELQRLTASAAAEQKKIVDAEKQTAREAEKSAAAQRKRWQELRRTLSAEETSINNVIAKLKVYQNTLNSSESGSRQFNNAVKEINRLSAKLEQMRNNIANLTGQAVAGQRRMTEAVQETNRAYSYSNNYISNLIKKSLILFGVHQIQRFTQKLRETTAEFELQRVSLGAIIQDTEKANALFNQIKTFAVQSPFEIKDLVGYVKQLSAYRIETDKLFDTTKRLADVSAGLGVDMGRLILAYGQVKAASVLRGQEVRQFTEAGIPLIQLLADKFTALRGEVVSTSEVFDLISQRAVSFEMVAEIFEEMTNAGGMFYNMQEKQAQTLAGQWSNLKDALSIMYDEMGRTSEVRGAMEAMIRTTKSLAQNWRTVYQVVEGASLSIAAMALVQKNATVTAAALTKQEALYTAVKSRQVKQTPKWIAAIIGERNARNLSIAVTRAHTVAMVKQATATNVLSKAFWKLTAAMLANPYILITGAVVALGYALFRLATNSETAADRVNKLNNAVGSMENYYNKVNPLIETYNELSNKLERTAEEEKKLKAVTKELAGMFPGAVKSVSEFGDEIELVGDKVNELYQNELKLRKQYAQDELEETEQKIKAEEEKIAKLREQLNEGFKTTTRVNRAGMVIIDEEVLTDADKKRILDLIDEIQHGKDNNGEGGLDGLYNSAELARDKIENLGKALGEIPEDNNLSSWKKTLYDLSRGITTISGVSIPPLFDTKTIEDFNSLDEALKKVAEQYKTNQELVEEYALTLKSTNLTEEERKSIQDAWERAQASADAYLAILDYYNQRKLLESKSGGGTDDRLSKLKEEVSLLEKIYNNYKKYIEYESKSDAQARINREFGETLRIFENYGIELPKTAEEYQAALRKLQDVMRGLPKSEKDVLELGFKIEQVNFDESKRNLENELKRLADEVSRTKTAKEFFDKMLNMTGDKELSTTVTMSVYGDTGKGLHDAIVAQIREAFKGIDDTALNLAIGVDTIDYKKLREIWESDKLLPDDLRKISSAYDKTIQEILNNAEKANADWLLDTFKMYEQFKTFEEQRTTITEQETERRNQINANASLTEEQRASLLAASLRREAEKLNDIDWAEFKASKDWIKTFEDIDNVATPTIERLIDKLRELIETHKDLTPEQLRTIMNEYNKLYNELIQRNPFKAIKDGLIEFSEATKELAAKRTMYKWLLATGASEERLAEAMEEVIEAQEKQKKSLNKTEKGFESLSNVASNLQSILSQVVDLFGVAEDSELGVFLSELGKMLGVIATVLSVIASVLAVIDTLAAPVLAVIAAVAALGALISWIAGIKDRKAQKEIEKQQEAIESLQRAYERLEKAKEKAFSGEYIQNLHDRELNALEEIERKQKQIEAEYSKRRKNRNYDDVDQWKRDIEDLQDKLIEMQSELSEHFLGTDLTGAARSFAQSWVQAYKEFGNTADAIEEEMETLMENLMTEAILGAIAEQALKPLFDYINNLDSNAFSLEDTWKEIFRLQQDAQKDMNTGLSVGAQYLEQMGILTRDMGGELTGITKDLASASEETMQGVAAEFNTLNYFVSHIDSVVSQMMSMMSGGGTEFSSNEQIADLITIQNEHLAYLPNIALNTAQTAERCERAAQACESIAENLNRVIKPKGISGTHQVNCSL